MEIAPPIQWLDEIPDQGVSETVLPLHVVIRMGLLHVIETKFDDGQRFWSEAELSDKLQVSRVTVRRALSDLSSQGALRRFRARGTFVRKAASLAPSRVQTNALPFKSLGVFVSQYNSQFTADMLDDFFSVAGAQRVAMHVYRTHNGDTGAKAIEQLRESPKDEAIILFAVEPDLTRALHRELERRGYRVITVDVIIKDYPSSYVGTNNDMGIRLGLRHLIDLGHRKITFLLSEPEDVVVSQERLNTFLAVSREQNIPEMQVVSAHVKLWENPVEAAYNMMEQVWSGPNGAPTAIMCASDAGAGGVLRWCAENNVSCPADVSVVGFDDDRTSRYLNPPLTTIAHPRADIARRAFDILVSSGQSHEYLAPSLVVRSSTGVPRKEKF